MEETMFGHSIGKQAIKGYRKYVTYALIDNGRVYREYSIPKNLFPGFIEAGGVRGRGGQVDG